MKQKILEMDVEVLKERIADGSLGARFVLERGLEEIRQLIVWDFERVPDVKEYRRAERVYETLLKYIGKLCRKHKLDFAVQPFEDEYRRFKESPFVAQMEKLVSIRLESSLAPKCDYKGSGEDGLMRVSTRKMGLDYLR